MSDLIIGSHVSASGKKMLLGAVEEALSYHANALMFYTGAPQNTYRRKIEEFRIEEAINLMKENNIDLNNVFVHAPYILNFANPKTRDFSADFFLEELQRVNAIGVKYVILHPGAHVGLGAQEGIKNIIDSLNLIFEKDHSNIVVLLETLAGKGSEVGVDIAELKQIINGINKKERIGVCLDTCHLHDSGVDLTNFDAYLTQFDQLIGLDYIKCLHINDSKNPCGASKDRHANIGMGEIGFETMMKVIYHPRLTHIAKILETPYINDSAPYGLEIEMIRNRLFDPGRLKALEEGEGNG